MNFSNNKIFIIFFIKIILKEELYKIHQKKNNFLKKLSNIFRMKNNKIRKKVLLKKNKLNYNKWKLKINKRMMMIMNQL